MHITDEKLWNILESRSLYKDNICYTITTTSEALAEDEINPDMPYDVLPKQEEHLDAAGVWWNKEGQPKTAIQELALCWSV